MVEQMLGYEEALVEENSGAKIPKTCLGGVGPGTAMPSVQSFSLGL
jgi:hypothetical protein